MRQPERITRLVQPDLDARAWATAARTAYSDVALAGSAAPSGGGTAATTDPAPGGTG